MLAPHKLLYSADAGDTQRTLPETVERLFTVDRVVAGMVVFSREP